MLFELSVLTASIYASKSIVDCAYNWATGISKVKKQFNKTMEGLGLKNKNNQFFQINNTYKTNFGYRCIINIPPGLSIEHLNSKLNILEDNLNSIIKIEKDRFKNYILMTIVNKELGRFDFEPVKHKVNEICIGKDFKGSNYFINLDTNPMILIAGATGYGKSMLLSNILSNIIYNHPKKTEIYLLQLIKGENSSFENCSNVKFNACNKQEVCFVINKLRKIIDERTELLKFNGVRNINQWNKHFPKRYLKRIIIACEEMSELMNVEDIWEDLWGVVKTGRSVGVHLIGVVQRTTATNLNTDVKSQMTRITFHQNSIIDSQNVINSNSALTLKQGECIATDKGETLIKVPYIDDDFVILNKYIPEIKTPNKEFKNPIINQNIQQDIKPKEFIDVDYKKVNKSKPRKGVISLEEINNVNSKR